MPETTRLVVGLGNPGSRYERTRHNVGFMLIDELARRWGVTDWKEKHKALVAHVPARGLLLAKPQTFMNASGEAVAPIAAWWKIPRSGVLIVYDDLDLPFGRLRLREQGSSGGHNGMKSIIASLGGEDFPRLRIGIGRGAHAAIEHVLAPFNNAEHGALARILDASAEGVERWLDEGALLAASFLNGWDDREPMNHESGAER